MASQSQEPQDTPQLDTYADKRYAEAGITNRSRRGENERDDTAVPTVRMPVAVAMPDPVPVSGPISAKIVLSPRARIIASLLRALLVGILLVGTGGSILFATQLIPPLNDYSYAVAVPGTPCDHGPGTWLPVNAANMLATCQPDGLLLTNVGADASPVAMLFSGKSGAAFSSNYQVGVTLQFQTQDPRAEGGLEVHYQGQKSGQSFVVLANGEWEIWHNDPQESNMQRLGVGFVDPSAATFAMVVDVHGPVLSLSINGVQVATVYDAAYATTQAVGIVLSGGLESTSVAALFSQFHYRPLGDLSPTQSAAAQAAMNAAEETAQSRKAIIPVPGPGCGDTVDLWAAPGLFGDTTSSLSCQSNGLRIAHALRSPAFSLVRYYNIQGLFPRQYNLAVVIDPSHMKTSCAGMVFRVDSQTETSFISLVCGGGHWELIQAQGSDHLTIVAQGITKATTQIIDGHKTLVPVYRMIATANGTLQSLAFNDVTVIRFPTPLYTTTDYVALVMTTLTKATSDAVVFSDFVLTPISG
jgi:hypothetical protein